MFIYKYKVPLKIIVIVYESYQHSNIFFIFISDVFSQRCKATISHIISNEFCYF